MASLLTASYPDVLKGDQLLIYQRFIPCLCNKQQFNTLVVPLVFLRTHWDPRRPPNEMIGFLCACEVGKGCTNIKPLSPSLLWTTENAVGASLHLSC